MSLRLSSQRFYLRACFYLLPALAFGAAVYIRFHNDPEVFLDLWRFYVGTVLFASVVWAVAAERKQLYHLEDLFHDNTGFSKCLSAVAATYLAVTCLLFFYRQESMSRIVLALSAILLFGGSVLTRVLFRYVLQKRFDPDRKLRIMIVGADQYAANVAKRLHNIPPVPCEVVAHVALEGQAPAVTDVELYQMEDLRKGLPVAVDDVIIALPPERLHQLSEVIRQLGTLSAPLRIVLDLGDVAVLRERWFQYGDLQMLDVATAPVESPYYFVAKRAFDVAFSSLALILVGPLMLLIALVVKLTSPGPVLFEQRRVGLNGQEFWMYKFRTMRQASTADSDTTWTTPDDQRRTRFGTFLRKTSLDELPQFFNVLKGDMSVVGPRPERPYFVGQFLEEISYYNSRHRLKVGITGWAQVNGWRGDTSIAKRFEFDLYYLQNWSLWFDFRIVWMTIWSGLFGKNAY
jgi:Undecaprenyl-phosphate glucose phosphotransferase